MYSLMFIVLILLCGKTSTNFLAEYTKRMCAGEPTCSFVDHQNLPVEYRVLGGRNCLCDSKCKEYQDCCVDSEYYRIQEQLPPFNFYCLPSKNVYMKTKCLSTWNDDNVITKCKKSILPAEDDLSIITPLTNINTGITYGNVYCAICNDVYTIDTMNEFFAWNLTTKCGELPNDVLPADSFPYTWKFEIPPSVILNNNQEIVVSANLPVLYPDLVNWSNNGYYLIDVLLYYVNESTNSIRQIRSTQIPVNIEVLEIRSPSNNLYLYLNRRKRLVNTNIDYFKYINEWPFIASNVNYNPFLRMWISHYKNINFVCEFDSVIPENELPYRICIPNVINECSNLDDAIFNHGCQIRTAVVYDKNGTMYRNKDCALCNGIKEKDIVPCPLLAN